MTTETHTLDVGEHRLVARVTRVDRRTAVALEVDGVEVAERQGWPVVRVPVEGSSGLEKATVVVVAPRPGRATVRLVVPAAPAPPPPAPSASTSSHPPAPARTAGTSGRNDTLGVRRAPRRGRDAQVVGGLLLARIALGFVLDLDWAWLPDWHLPRLPRPHLPDLPDIPWPDLDLPDWSLPGWLAAVLASKKYWFPILVAIGVAVAEVRRRRRRDADNEGGRRMQRGPDRRPREARRPRLQIIDAGLTCFAAHGYDGATTALICREAGIGSGTFFHYFPTKADLLVATLELGTGETEEWFAARRGRPDAVEVLREYVAHAAAESADPRVPGFVRAVGAVMTEPRIAAALAADERTLRVAGCCRGCARPRPPARYGPTSPHRG